jgi:protein-S-isoprenylcysteine O-methyltransferase Ste14
MALREEFEKQGVWLFKYRGNLPIIILVLGYALYIYKEYYPEAYFLQGDDLAMEACYEWLCLAICFSGLVIRAYTVGHTPRFTSGRNTDEQVAETLNSTGLYSILRHPLYLGNFLMWLGVGMLTGHIWFIVAFILFYWLYYERIMYAEEQFLTRKFGQNYTDWAEGVPSFIPSFKNFKKPSLRFSWKKVMKKEKNGLFAMFLLFALFDMSGEYVHGTTDYNMFLVYGCIATGVAYIILKFLKKKTSVLDEEGR